MLIVGWKRLSKRTVSHKLNLILSIVIILKKNTEAIQKKELSFLLDSGQFNIQKPNKRVTNNIRSTLGYILFKQYQFFN